MVRFEKLVNNHAGKQITPGKYNTLLYNVWIDEGEPRLQNLKIAVIGSGISGLTATWLLQKKHDVTLYEKNNYLGGHTNTVDVTIDEITFPVDTGFLVFNKQTYPNLINLFKTLQIESTKSEMSFSYTNTKANVEWAGRNIKSLFAQTKNLYNPDFWRMLYDIVRFNNNKHRFSSYQGDLGYTLEMFLNENNYSAAFREWYLLPMAGAIWSCPLESIKKYPFASFIDFFNNHGLLNIFNRPQWLSVKGGGREYVRKLKHGMLDVKQSNEVKKITRHCDHVHIEDEKGNIKQFSHVILATHADQCLQILENPSNSERAILENIRFTENTAILHTDENCLPSNKSLHSAWNYRVDSTTMGIDTVSVSYLLNLLQPLPTTKKVFLTLNPLEKIKDQFILNQFAYSHPVLDAKAKCAQSKLFEIQGEKNTWFCGAWTGNGFHEHGLTSALSIATHFEIKPPWLES